MGDKLKTSYDDILYNRGTKIGRIVDDETRFDMLSNQDTVRDRDRLISRLLEEYEQQKAKANLWSFILGWAAGIIVATALVFLGIVIGK